MIIYKLKKMADTLKMVHSEVYHYHADTKNKRYIVWAEEAEANSLYGNDKKDAQVISGSIDLYTNIEFDELIDNLQKALRAADVTFVLNSVQYEDETELIHYEWTWEI